jgi:hypothetical protein
MGPKFNFSGVVGPEFNFNGVGLLDFNFVRVNPKFNLPLGIPQNVNPAGVGMGFNNIQGLPQGVNFFEPNLDFHKPLELLQNPGVIEAQPVAREIALESGEVDLGFAQNIEARECWVNVGEEKLRLFLEGEIYDCETPVEFYFNPNEFQCNVPVLVCCEVCKFFILFTPARGRGIPSLVLLTLIVLTVRYAQCQE